MEIVKYLNKTYNHKSNARLDGIHNCQEIFTVQELAYMFTQPHSLHGQSASWEINSHSASQEIPLRLRNTKVYLRLPKAPALIPILSQINLAYISISHFFNNHHTVKTVSTSKIIHTLITTCFGYIEPFSSDIKIILNDINSHITNWCAQLHKNTLQWNWSDVLISYHYNL
jgi:hypothetical protein